MDLQRGPKGAAGSSSRSSDYWINPGTDLNPRLTTVKASPDWYIREGGLKGRWKVKKLFDANMCNLKMPAHITQDILAKPTGP